MNIQTLKKGRQRDGLTLAGLTNKEYVAARIWEGIKPINLPEDMIGGYM